MTSTVNIKHTTIQRGNPVRESRCVSRFDLTWRRNNTKIRHHFSKHVNTTRHVYSKVSSILFGLTVGLRKSEIESSVNYLFLILVYQLQILQMIVSNMFSPITHDDHKVKVMIIRNVTVDYILINREDFEGWFKVCQDGEDFDKSTITVSSSGRRDTRERSLFWDYRWTSKFYKFNTTTKSISVYQFPRSLPSEYQYVRYCHYNSIINRRHVSSVTCFENKTPTFENKTPSTSHTKCSSTVDPEMKNLSTTFPTPLITTDVFTTSLEDVHVEDWCRTWVTDWTIILRRTSKTVKQ